MSSIAVPSFRRPQLALEWQDSGIRSLPELIHFNAKENPSHTFCLQAEINRRVENDDTRYNVRQITMQEIESAIGNCVSWIRQTLPNQESSAVDPTAPVALYLESDVCLFIYLAALLEMNIPVLLLSARLSPASVAHLMSEANAQTIFLSPRTKGPLEQKLAGLVSTNVVVPYATFLDSPPNGHGVGKLDNIESQGLTRQHPLILHSSGTTGLPKPIPVSGRYPIVYAACHEFPDDTVIDWANMSTLPLYHGFGLLAPCLSLSVGLACCFPPSSIIPGAQSTIDLLTAFSAGSLMTVPSIMDDVLALHDRHRSVALKHLADLQFVAVGGGALSHETAAVYADHGVKLLNHYGVTEIGALAPIFCPGPDYDWKYLRIRNDIGLKIYPIEPQVGHRGLKLFKLVGKPIGSEEPFEIQDEMETNPNSNRLEVKLLGRRDDMIVLKTGEKVLARVLENGLNSDANIKNAVCIGQGHFEVLVLIEKSPISSLSATEFVDHVWKLLQDLNPQLDQHARVSSKSGILLKPVEKNIPRSDKGSIMRREVHVVFKDEIEAAYAAMERETPVAAFDIQNVEQGIRNLVQTVSDEKTKHHTRDANDDFFEKGMDSLQSVRLARCINAAVRATVSVENGQTPLPTLSAEFIYQHSSIKRLSEAISLIISGRDLPVNSTGDRSEEISAMLEEFTNDLASIASKSSQKPGDRVVLLTGSTGNLGSHILGRLARHSSVRLVFCLIRPDTSSRINGARDTSNIGAPPARQLKALFDAGIELGAGEWKKIRFLESELSAPHLGLDPDEISGLHDCVTDIVHLAWPMDFNRTLESFRPHLKAVKTLIQLACLAHQRRPHTAKVRLVFTSSIAVVRHHASRKGQRIVPEDVMADPLVTTEMGYAEGKWVCEQMMAQAGQEFAQDLEAITVRVGQLSGPERDGVWKTAEHVPALLKASQQISAFPRLEGNMSWIPVDRAAKSLIEILFQPGPLHADKTIFHLENPVRQSMLDFATLAKAELRIIGDMVPFDEWLVRVTKAGCASSLHGFFRDHFQALGSGTVILATDRARAASRSLRGSSGVGNDLIVKYIDRWRRIGFIQ